MKKTPSWRNPVLGPAISDATDIENSGPDDTVPDQFTSDLGFADTMSYSDLMDIEGRAAHVTPAGDSRVELSKVCPSCGRMHLAEQQYCHHDGSPLHPILSRADLLENCGIGCVLDGRYLITDEIARSRNAIVVAAQHMHLDQEVAIKFINPRLLNQTGMSQRLQAEAARTAALSHSGIVKVTDFGIARGDVPYLAMERLVGMSLHDAIKERSFSVRSVINLGRQMCAALRFIHERNVIHCDLKPCNIWLSESVEGRVRAKLLDFGISRARRDAMQGGPANETSELVGTPGYMAPEQCVGGTIDAKTDIYALGCVLWEALVGRPMISTRSTLDTLRHQVSIQPISPARLRSDIPDTLSALILRAVEKDPQLRFPNVVAMETQLRLIRNGL